MWLVYALLSAIFAAGVAIVGKLGLKNIDSTLATTVRSVIMAVFLLIVSFLLKKFQNFSFSSFSSKDWWLIAFSGIFGALSWLFYFFALKDGQATAVVAIDRLSMAFVFILALIFLGETFSIKGLIGVVLIVAGAILFSLK
ncbi:MAG TPA: EamA family transporter [bacterium]|nr:EamA family transporter [bacterium]HPV65744.1 EamA family transporter [bacterium]